MMTVRWDVYKVLEQEAELREVSVQELLRAVILPDWTKRNARLAKDATRSSHASGKELSVSTDG